MQEIEQFKRQNELAGDEAAVGTPTADFSEEIDLRAEDDALIAAELEAAAQRTQAEADSQADEEEENGDEGEQASRSRRRSRRGRRPSKRAAGPLEGTFDHGEEGYGLWLDPAIQDNPVYAEHWAGHRPVEVTIEEDQIIIRRIGEQD